MLELLTNNWAILLLRGAAAVLFGALALFWPGLTLVVLVFLFGAYALIEGVGALSLAIIAWRQPGFGRLLLAGLFGVAAGIVAFTLPGLTTVALLALIAAWAILTGIFQIAAALTLRKELTGEWVLALGGILSVILGLLLMLRPAAGALSLVWMIGIYAIAFGFTLVALGLRLRQTAFRLRRA